MNEKQRVQARNVGVLLVGVVLLVVALDLTPLTSPAASWAQSCQLGGAQACQVGAVQQVQQVQKTQQVYVQQVQPAQYAAAGQGVAYSQQIVQKRVAQQPVAQQHADQHAGQYAQLNVQKINQVYVPQAVYHEQQVLLPAYDHEYSFAASQAAYRSGLGGYHAQAIAPDPRDATDKATDKKLNQKLDKLASTVEQLAEIVARQVAHEAGRGAGPDAGRDAGRDAGETAGETAAALGRKLFVQRCVACHRGKQPEGRPQFAEFDGELLTLAAGAKQKIYEAIQAGRMPPAKDGHGNALETPLPDDEFLAIGAWLQQDGWRPEATD
jgi:mono/diheme cytochrome c family protein